MLSPLTKDTLEKMDWKFFPPNHNKLKHHFLYNSNFYSTKYHFCLDFTICLCNNFFIPSSQPFRHTTIIFATDINLFHIVCSSLPSVTQHLQCATCHHGVKAEKYCNYKYDIANKNIHSLQNLIEPAACEDFHQIQVIESKH